jgi:hypothetical protein
MTSTSSSSRVKGCEIQRDVRWTYTLRVCGVYAKSAFLRLKALAPYALIELILPGGSVMAVLLWLYRRRSLADGAAKPLWLKWTLVAPVQGFGPCCDCGPLSLDPCGVESLKSDRGSLVPVANPRVAPPTTI